MLHIANCSGGKDSVATIILDHLYEHVIQKIVYCEVMYDDSISAEYPEHIAFIKSVLFPTFESWGYEIVYLKSDKTFLDCFYHKRTNRSKNCGKIVGFMISGHCDVQGICKLQPIKRYFNLLDEDYIQYIGIAADEPRRLKTAHEKGQISLLEKYGYSEQMAIELCQRYHLLSPIYKYFKRSGCFFCPNASDAQLRYLYHNHRELYNKLLALESEPNKVCNTFCYGKSYKEYAYLFEHEWRPVSLFDIANDD